MTTIETTSPSLPRIVGVREAAALLGITPASLSMRLARRTLPEPDARLACGPIWLYDRMAAFALAMDES